MLITTENRMTFKRFVAMLLAMALFIGCCPAAGLSEPETGAGDIPQSDTSLTDLEGLADEQPAVFLLGAGNDAGGDGGETGDAPLLGAGNDAGGEAAADEPEVQEGEDLKSIIERMVAAVKAAEPAEGNEPSSIVTVVLKKGSVYSNDSFTVGNQDDSDTTYKGITDVIVKTEDAGDDGLSADGSTILNLKNADGAPAGASPTLTIRGINLVIKGLKINGKVSAEDKAALDYSGTKADDTLDVTADATSTVSVATGAGKDTVTATDNGGSMTIQTGSGDDTITAVHNGGEMTVEAGDGDDTVKVGQKSANGGTVTVDTGDGSDTVAAETDANNGGEMAITTGDGEDTVTASHSGGDMTITTGDGADKVAAIDKAAQGKLDVDTGDGDDTVEMDMHTAGQGITVNTGAGDDAVTLTSSLASGDSPAGTIAVELGAGINSTTVNTSVGMGAQKLTVGGTDGNDHLHITGTLADGDDRATGTRASMKLKDVSGRVLEIGTTDIESITDDLENKKTVKLTPAASGENAGSLTYDRAESFINYIINAPASTLKNITVSPKDNADIILSNVIIDTDTFTNGDNELKIENGTTIDTRGLTLVLKAKNIKVNGTLMADLVQLEALDGTGMYSRNFKDQYDGYSKTENFAAAAFDAVTDVLWDMVNIKDKATITVGSTGKIYSAGDVIMLARVEQSGNLISTIPVNAVNVKVGEAYVDIEGTVLAGVTDFKNPTVGNAHGSVRADAQVKTTTGGPQKETILSRILDGLTGGMPDNYPIAVTVAYADAAVRVAKGARVEAAKDISLASKSEVKTYTRADSGLFGAPFAIAVNVLVNNATTDVAGTLDAHTGDVRVEADAESEAKAVADKGEGQNIKSGGYVAVSVVLQDAKAAISQLGVVNAGGKVRVESKASEKVENKATSAQLEADPKEEKKDDDSPNGSIIDELSEFLKETILPKISSSMSDSPSSQEKLEGAMKKLASGKHSAQLDDDAQKKGAVTLTDNTSESSVTYGVKIQPWAGYKVKSVTARGYNPGSGKYLECTVQKLAENSYLVTPKNGSTAVANVTIFVEYEEDDSYEEPTAGDLFDEHPQEEEEVDLQSLLDDLNNSTDDDSGEELERALNELEDAEIATFVLENNVLTYEIEPTEKDKVACRVEYLKGEKVRLIPNPGENQKLKDGGLKVEYTVQGEDGKKTKKTVVVTADSKGRYYFTVPDDALTGEDNKFTVKAEYEGTGTEEKKGDEDQSEGVGAIAVVVADNDSRAIIDAGAQVTSGKMAEVYSEAVMSVTNSADGSPAGKKEEAAGGETKEKAEGEAIKRDAEDSKTEAADDMKYGLIVEETINGKVAVGSNEDTPYQYTFTPSTEAEGYAVAKVLLYYISGGEQKTQELTATDGTYTVNLADENLKIDAGTTARISVSFAKDGEYGVVVNGAGQDEQILLDHPIKVSYNNRKGSNDSAVSMGTVSYTGVQKDADGRATSYTFTVAPAAGCKLDGTLKASWKDASGADQTADLTQGTGDDAGKWTLSVPANIPAGAVITVTGKFADDLRDLKKADGITNGSVTLYDEKIKQNDTAQVTVKPDPGYSVTSITVTFNNNQKLTWKADGTGDAAFKKVDGKDTLYSFTLPDGTALAAGSSVTVTAQFDPKTIPVYAGSTDSDKNYTLSEKRVAVGDTVTVTLSDANVKAGKKIKTITVTGDDANVEVTGNTFKVKEGTTKALTVNVTLADKEISLPAETKLTGGKLAPAAPKADWNETVTVKVTPDKNFKVKQGTLKAIVKAKDGTYSEELILSRQNDTTYTFQMPSQGGKSASNMEITFTGEFEPGQSDTTAMDTSMGAAIAVTVANSESRSEVKGKVTSGSAVSVESKTEGGVKTESKAGYSKGNIGIGGAVSVQIASMDSKALVHGNADIQLDGKLSVASSADATFDVNADASGKKEAAKVGVGAGIAVAVNGSDAVAGIQDGAGVGKNKGDAVKGISVTAAQKVKDTVNAKAGASGGTAAVPVAAVDVTAANANAYMGRVSGSDMTLTEDMAVSATTSAEHTVTADASASGKGAGVGAAIVVSVVFDEAIAKLNQSVKANKVTVAAETVSKLKETATAGASGGKKEKESKDPDKQADGLLGAAGNMAGKNKSSGISAGKIDKVSKDRQKAETSEGSVGVAGAVAVNVQVSTSKAEVADNINIKADDLAAVTTLNGTTSLVKANASTTNSDIGVGVGVAVNIVFLDNIASIGRNGTIDAGSLKVAAATKMTEPEAKKEEKKEEKADDKNELAKMLGEKVGDYVNDLVEEIGLDKLISADLLGEIISPVVTEATNELIKASGIGDMLDANFPDKVKSAASQLMNAGEGLMALPELMIDDLMGMLDSAIDLDGMSLTSMDLAAIKDSLLSNFKAALTDRLKSAGSSILTSAKDGMIQYLMDNMGEIIAGVFTGDVGEKVGEAFGKAKDIITESVKKETKTFVNDVIHTALEKTIEDNPDLQQNIESVETAIRKVTEVKDAYQKMTMDNLITQASEYVTDTFKKNVFDYEEMLTLVSKVNFKAIVTDGLKNAAKKASVTLTNEVISALSDHFDLALKPEEEKATGHVIDTQAIAGAGAREVGVAGSAAITVLNTETSATIADGGTITVGKDMTVEADDTITVKNTASAAVDSKGNASENKAAGKKAEKDVGGGNDAGTKADAKHVSMETATGASLKIREGDIAQDKPRIYITVKPGYKLPEKDGAPYATYTYIDEENNEVTGTIEISKTSDGELYVDAKTGDLSLLDSDQDVHLDLKPVEVLRSIHTPTLLTDQQVDVEEGAVTVTVKDREAEKDSSGNPQIQAHAGETVQITIAKAQGRKVSGIGYSWKDDEGKTHDVEFNGTSTGKSGAEKAFTLVSSNDKEIIYSFTMPDGEVTDIVAVFEKDDEPETTESQTTAKDENGKSVGVGAAFSMVYGDNTVKASIGKRTVTAGELSVTATADHQEKIAGAAGTDPLAGGEDAKNVKDTSVDASVALNIVDYDVMAGISAGSVITTKGYTDGDTTRDGDLTVSAKENAVTETTGSAFAAGGKTAVGATAAINIANTAVAAEMAGQATVAGSANITADSHSEDTTKAIATAMGADIARSLAKLGETTDNIEEKGNKLLDGSYVDELSKKKEEQGDKKDDKKENKTADKINERMNEKKQDGGKDTSSDNSVSSNALRSQGVKVSTEETGSEGTGEAHDTILKHAETDLGMNSSNQEESEWQVAAAVGVTVAEHAARTTVGSISAGKTITVAAGNTGNFNTMGTGAAMSMAKHANSIAAGVAVSVNDNKANVSVSGDLIAGGDLSVTSRLTQNMDGGFAGKLAAQALSGSVAGADSDVSIGGAVSVVVSFAESTVNIAGGTSEAKRKLEGAGIVVEATDKSKLTSRAGGLSISKGSSVGMGIASSNVISGNTVTASVGDETEITGNAFKLNAEKLAVTMDDYKSLVNWSTFASDSSQLNDDQRKEANTGLIDLHKGDDDESYSMNIDLTSDKLLGLVDGLNFLSAQNTYVEAIAGSIMTNAGKEESNLSLAGSFAVAVTNNKITASLGKNAKVTLTKTDSQTADMTVNAADGATTRIIAGSMSAAPSKASVGATVAVLVMKDHVKAETGSGAVIDAAGDVNQNAKVTSDTQVFTAAMSVAAGTKAKVAAGGAINVIVSNNKAENILGTDADITSGGNVNLTAKADQDLIAISGSANVTASSSGESTVAAGGVLNVIVDKTQALNDLSIKKATAAQNMTIDADVKDRLISGTASISAAVSVNGKAGAGVANVIVSKSVADTAVKGKTELTATEGSLAVGAHNDAWMLNASLAASGAMKTAVGAAFNVNVFSRTAAVHLTEGTLTAGKDILVQADGRDTDILAGLSVSGSVSGSSLSGNVIVGVESNNIALNVAKGVTANAGRNAIIESYFSDFTVVAGGSLAVSGSDKAFGATILTVVKNNDVLTEIGSSSVTANAAGNVKTKGMNNEETLGVRVGAEAQETQFFIAAGIAAAGKGDAMNGEVVVLVNNNTVLADAAKAVLRAQQNKGTVTVGARDKTVQTLVAGGLNFSGAGNAAGAAVVTLVSNKTIDAKAHDLYARYDVNVTAENEDNISTLALSAGVSGGGSAIQIGAAVQVLKSHARATVGSTVVSNLGNFNLNAANNTKLLNVAGAVAGAGGGNAVAPVGAITYFQGEANAVLKPGSKVTASSGNINITSESDKKVTMITAGISASSGFGLSGAANVLVSKDKAYAGVKSETEPEYKGMELDKSSLTAGGDLNIHAQNDYKLRAVSGAIGVGTTAIGVNAVVSILKSQTVAELGGDATAGGDLSVKAFGNRDVINAAATLAAGQAAGGITVMVLVAGTKMSQDAADMIARGNGDDANKKTGFDASKFMENAGKAGIDFDAINADETDKDRQLNGSILEQDLAGNGHRESEESVGHKEKNGDGEEEATFDGASGYRSSEIDTKANDAEDGDNRGEKMDASDTKDVTKAKNMNTYTYDSSALPEDAVIARILGGETVSAKSVTVQAGQGVAADLIGAAIGVGQLGGGISTVVAILHSNVIASSMANIKSAPGGVTVKAESKNTKLSDDHDSEDRDATLLDLMSNKPVDEDADEKDKKKAEEDKKSTIEELKDKISGRSIRAFSLAVGAGEVGLGVSVAVVLTDNVTQAILGGNLGKAENEDEEDGEIGEVSVTATHNYGSVMAATGSLAAGMFAAGVSVSVAQANGSVKALIADGAKVKTAADKSIRVATDTEVNVDSIAVTAGAGMVAINAGIALSFNRLTQETGIGAGTTIESGKDIEVSAKSKTTGNNFLLGVSVGGVGVSVNAAVSNVSADIDTHIGGDAKESTITAAGDIRILNDTYSAAIPRVITVAAGGVAVGGNVLLAFNDTNASAAMKNATVKASNMTVIGDLAGEATSSLAAVQIGAIAVGLSVNYADMRADNRAAVMDSKLDLTGDLVIRTGAGTHNATSATADTVSANMGLATLGINTAIARNNTKNYAILTGTKDVTVGGDMTVHGAGESSAKATVKGFELSALNVAVTAVVALNDADARTKVDLKNTKVTGMATFDGTQKASTDAYMVTGGGSLLSAKVSAAVAYGRAKSQIDVDIRGKGEFAGIKSLNDAYDEVKADIENGSFSAISAAARFSAAYSQDAFTTNIIMSGPVTTIGEAGVDVQTVYLMDTDAIVTPSTSGVDISLASLAINGTIAKNTAKANAAFEAIKGNAHVLGDVKVIATGTVTTDATVRTALISVGGVSLGANIAKSDLSVTQEAHLRVGGTLTVDGAVDVQSLAKTATADATISPTGGSKEGLSINVANMDISRAVAKENMASSAVVLGGPVTEVEEYETIDKGHYEEKTVGYIDYEVLVDDGRYVVRDDKGVVQKEQTTVITYNTGEYEVRNAIGEVIDDSHMNKDYTGTRKVRRTTTREGDMIRFGAHYAWVEETITEWVPNKVQVPYKVNVYNADENKLNAASLNIFTGAVEGTKTGATATTNGPRSVSLIAAGSLDAKAISSDRFSVVFEGMTATITGAATLMATSNTVSYAEGSTPGGYTLVNSASSEVTSQVGTRNDKQTTAVVIGKGNTLNAKAIEITAKNIGAAQAFLDQGTSGALASVQKTTQPTESWYSTLVSVGRGATLNATDGDVTITSSDAPEATSNVKTGSYSLTLNLNNMMGQNKIDQENNLDIGESAIVKATGSVILTASQLTKASAETVVDGGGLVDGTTAKAQNDIYRVARVNIGSDATVSGSTVTLNSFSGVGDKIRTKAYVGSVGIAALGKAKAYTNLEGHAEIILSEGAKVTATGSNLTLDARATSVGADGDYGVHTHGEVNSGGLVPLPDSVARNNLNMTSFIDINQDPGEGQVKDQNRRKVTLTSENRDVRIFSTNEGMNVYALARSKGKGAAGTSNANAWNAATLINVVWIDDADITGTNITIYAENGGNLKDTIESHKVHLYSDAYAELMAAGGVVEPVARISGEMINQIRSYNVKNVTFTKRDGGKVIHKTAPPQDAVVADAKTGSKRVKVLFFSFTKDNSESIVKWYVANRCDFCGEGTEYDVKRTNQTTLEKRYEDAFDKALAPINEIQRMVANSTIVTKARYGEEEHVAAGRIFVLDVKSMLDHDVQLNPEQIKRYRLWTNTQTYLNTYLMPNAARLYTNGAGRLQYAVDIISGDIFGEGWDATIEILTALTNNAFANPVIPIGSTGSLDLNTGLLTLPDQADFELYLFEISGAWLRDNMTSGFIRRLVADQNAVNGCALNGSQLPDGAISEGLSEDTTLEEMLAREEAEGTPGEWKLYWVGPTPETAEDPDQPLICLLINEETDEVDAFRTSVNMIANGEDPIDVSLFLYRDSKADRMGEEKYNAMFFDTPEGQDSLVKVVTSVLFDRKLEVPLSMKIVLRGRYLEGADKPVYCLSDHVFILCDGTDGEVDVLGGYHATFDGDTFDSNYTKIEGIRDNNLSVTIKENQPVWPEWNGDDTAEDVGGTRFRQNENDEWEQIPDDETVMATR